MKKTILQVVGAVTVAHLLVEPVAFAATQYWDGNGATAGAGTTPTGIWGTDSFWTSDSTGSSATGAWTGGNDAVFSAGVDATGNPYITVNGTQTANGIAIEEGTLTFVGGTLSINVGGITISGGVGATTIGPAITLAGAQAWANNSGNTLTIGGNIANSTYLLTVGGTGDTTINGIIGNGSGGLTKTGAGTLTLGGANTFSGPMTLSGGKVVLKTLGGLGSGATTLANETTVELSNDGTAYTWAPTFTTGGFDLSSGSTTVLVGRATIGSAVAATISGAVTLAGGTACTTTVAVGSSVYTNTAYSLTFSGTATLNGTHTFDVTNNATGAGYVYFSTLALNAGGSGGTLDAANNGQVQFNTFTGNSKPLTLGAGSGGTIVNNAGAMAMGSQKLTIGGDTVYLQQNLTPSATGGLDLNGGTLVANLNTGDNGTYGIVNYGLMTFKGGALETRNNGGNVTYTTGGIDLSQGTGTFRIGAQTANYAGRQHLFTGAVSLGNGRTVYVEPNVNTATGQTYYADFTGATTLTDTQTFNVSIPSGGVGWMRFYTGGLTLQGTTPTVVKDGAGSLYLDAIAFNSKPLAVTANAGSVWMKQAMGGTMTATTIGGTSGRVYYDNNGNNASAGITVASGGNLVGYGNPGDSQNGYYLRLGTINLQDGGIIELRSNNNDVRFVVTQLNANSGGTSRLRPGMLSVTGDWRHNHYVNGPVAIGGGSILIVEPTPDTIKANETFFSVFPGVATLTGAQTIQIADNGTGAGTFQINNLTTGGGATLTAATTGGSSVRLGWWSLSGQYNVAHSLLLQGTGTGNIWWYAPTSTGSGAITIGSGAVVTAGGNPGDNNTSYIFANAGATSTHQLIINGGTLRAYSGNWNTTIATGGLDLSQGGAGIVAYPGDDNNRGTRFNGAIVLGGGRTTTFSVTNRSANNDYAISLTGSATLTGTHTITGTANGTGNAYIGLSAYYNNGNAAGSSGGTFATAGSGAAQINLTGAAQMSIGSLSVINGAPLTVNNTATSTLRLATGGGSITLNDDLTILAGQIRTDLASSSTPTGGKKLFIGGGGSPASLVVDKDPGGDSQTVNWLNGLTIRPLNNGTFSLYPVRWNTTWNLAGLDLTAGGNTVQALGDNNNRVWNIGGPVTMGSGATTAFTFSNTGGAATMYIGTPTVTGSQTVNVAANMSLTLGGNSVSGVGTVATGGGGGTLIQTGTGALNICQAGGTVNLTAGKLTLGGGTFNWYSATSTGGGLGLDLSGGTTLTVYGNVADSGTFNGLANVGVINFVDNGITLKFWEDNANVTFTTGGLNLGNANGTIMVGGRNGNNYYVLSGAVTLGSGRTTTIRNSDANFVTGRSNEMRLSGLATLTGTHTFDVIPSPNTEYAPLTLTGGLTTAGAVPAVLNFTGSVGTGIGNLTIAASAPLTLTANSGGNTISGTLTANDKLTLSGGVNVFTGAGPAAGGGGIDIGGNGTLRIDRSVGDNVTHVTLNNAGTVNFTSAGCTFDMRSTSGNQAYTLTGLNLSNADATIMAGGRNGDNWYQINGPVTLGGGRTTTFRNSDANYVTGRSNPLYLSGVVTLSGTHTVSTITSPNTEYLPVSLTGTLTSSGGGLATLNKSGAGNLTIGAITVAASSPLTVNMSAGNTYLNGNITANDKLTLTGTGTYEMTTRTTGAGAGGLDIDGVTLLLSANDGTSPHNSVNVGVVRFLNSAVLDMRNNNTVTYATGGIDLSAGDATIQESLSSANNGLTRTLTGAVTLGNNRTTTISAGANMNANTAYGISLSGTATLDGTHTFTVNNNGTGLGTLTVAGLTLAGGGTATHTFTKNGTGTMTVSTTFTNTDGDNFTVSVASGSWMTITPAVAMGAGKLTKDGDGDLWFGNAGNSGTGGIDVNAGGVGCLANGAGPLNAFKMGTLTLKGGGVLTRNDNSGTYATDGIVLNQGSSSFSIQRNAAGSGPTHTFSGAVSLGGGYATTVSSGYGVNSGTEYHLGFSGNATIDGAHTFTVGLNATSEGYYSRILMSGGLTLNGAGTNNVFNMSATSATDYSDIEFSGVVSGAGKGLFKDGYGNLRLWNTANTYDGPTVARGSGDFANRATAATGALVVNRVANAGAASCLGQSSSAASNLILDGARLQIANGPGAAQSTDRLFTMGTRGAYLYPSMATYAVSFDNTGSIAFEDSGSRSLWLGGGGTNATAHLLRPVLSDPSGGTLSLVKTDSVATWQIGSSGDAANTYSGGTTVGAGTLVIAKSAGMGSGAVSVTGGKLTLQHAGAGTSSGGGGLTFSVANGGALEISLAQSTFPARIDVAGGGALAGDMTGAIYSGVGQNVFLSPGSVFAPTVNPPAGPLGFGLYRALNWLTNPPEFNVSSDGLYPSGAAFGAWTPAGTFAATVQQTTGVAQDLEVLMGGTSQTLGASTGFVLIDPATTRVRLTGSGTSTISAAPGGNATTFIREGPGWAGTAGWNTGVTTSLAFANSANMIGAGQKWTLFDGLARIDNASLVNATGTLEMGSGGWLNMGSGQTISTGNFRFLAGGGWRITPGDTYNTGSVSYYFEDGSVISSVTAGAVDLHTKMPAAAGKVDYIVSGDQASGTTTYNIRLGNGRRITTAYDNNSGAGRTFYVNQSGATLANGIIGVGTAGSTYILSAAVTNTLSVNEPIDLTNGGATPEGGTLQIGDTGSYFTTAGGADGVDHRAVAQSGTVQLSQSNANLVLGSSGGINVVAGWAWFNTANMVNDRAVTIGAGGTVYSTVADGIAKGTTGSIGNSGLLYGGAVANAFRGGNVILNAGGQVMVDINNNGDRDFGSTAASLVKIAGNSTFNIRNNQSSDRTAYFGPLDFTAGGAKLTVTDTTGLGNNTRFANLGVSGGSPWTANGEIETTTGDAFIQGTVYNTTGLILTKSGSRTLALRGDSSGGNWTGAGGLAVNAGWVLVDTSANVLGTTTGTQVNNGGYLQSNYGNVTGPTSAINGSTVTINSGGYLYADNGTQYHLAGGMIVLNGGTLWANIGQNADRDFGSSATSIVKVNGNSTVDVVNSDNGWNRADRAAYLGVLGFVTGGAKLTVTDRNAYPWEDARASNYSNARFASLGLAAGSPWTTSGGIETTTGDAIIQGLVYDTTGMTITKTGSRYLYLRGNSAATWSGVGGLVVNAGWVVVDTSANVLGTTTGTQVNSGGYLQSNYGNVTGPTSAINGSTVTVNSGGYLYADNGTTYHLAGGTIVLNGGTLWANIGTNGDRDFISTATTTSIIKVNVNSTVDVVNSDSGWNRADRTAYLGVLGFVTGGAKLTVTDRNAYPWEDARASSYSNARFASLGLAAGSPWTVSGEIETTTGDAIIQGAIYDSTGLTLTKSGSRYLYLRGNSAATWSGAGGLIVNGGWVVADTSANVLGTTTGSQVNNDCTFQSAIASAFNGGTLRINSGGMLYAAYGTSFFAGGSVVLNGGTVRTLNNTTYVYGGAFSVLDHSTMDVQDDNNNRQAQFASLDFTGVGKVLTMTQSVGTGGACTLVLGSLGVSGGNPWHQSGEIKLTSGGGAYIRGVYDTTGLLLTKSGPKTLTIDTTGNQATWTGIGGLVVNEGTVVVGVGNGLGVTTGTQVNNSGTLRSAAANAINGATVRINTGGMLYAANGTSFFSGGSIALNGGTVRIYQNSNYNFGGAFSVLDNSVVDLQDDNGNRQGQFASLDFTGVGKVLTMTQSVGTGGAGTLVLGSLGVSGGNPWHQSGEIKLTSGGGAYIRGVYDTTGLLLTKSGPKTLTIDTTGNQATWTGSGGLVVNEGTVVVGVGNGLGVTTGTQVNNSGTLRSAAANAINGATVRINTGGMLYAANGTSFFSGGSIALNGGTVRIYQNNNYNFGGAFSVLDNSVVDLQDDNGNRQGQFASLDFTGVGKVLTMTQSAGTGGAGTMLLGSLGVSGGNPWHQSGEINLSTGGGAYLRGVYDTTGLFLTKSGPKTLTIDSVNNQANWTGTGGLIVTNGTAVVGIAYGLGTTSGNQVTNSGTLYVNNIADAVSGTTIAVNDGGTLYGNANVDNVLRGATIGLNQGGRITLRDQYGQTWGSTVPVSGDATFHVVGFDNRYSLGSKLGGLTVSANNKVLTFSEKGENAADQDRWVQINGDINLGANNVTINCAADPGISGAAAGGFRQYTTGNLYGSGTITKSGSGEMYVGSNNSGKFSGNVIQNAGTNYVANTKAFGDAPTFTVNGGTLVAYNAGTDQFGTGVVNLNSPATLLAGSYGSYDLPANALRGATFNINSATATVHNAAAIAVGGNFMFQGSGNVLNLSANNSVAGSHTFGTLALQGGTTVGLAVNGRPAGNADMEAYFTSLSMNTNAVVTMGSCGRLRADAITCPVGKTLTVSAYDQYRYFNLGGGGNNTGFYGDILLTSNADMLLNASIFNGGITIGNGTVLNPGSTGKNLKRLIYNAGATLAGTGGMTVNAGGYLGGDGTLDATTIGRITLSASSGIAPGQADSVGTITINSNLTLPATATYYWHVAGVGSADKVYVPGSLGNNGTFDPGPSPLLRIIDVALPPLIVSDEITVAQWTGTDPAKVAWNFEYGGSSGITGNRINWDGDGGTGDWDTGINWDKTGFLAVGATIKYYEADGVTLQPDSGSTAGGYIKVTGLQSGNVVPWVYSDVYVQNNPPNPLVVTGPAAALTIGSLTLGGGANTARLNLGTGPLTIANSADIRPNGHIDVGAGTLACRIVESYGRVDVGASSTVNVGTFNTYAGSTNNFATGASGTVTNLNAFGGEIGYAASCVTTGNFYGGVANMTAGTLPTVNVATNGDFRQSGGTVTALNVGDGNVAVSGTAAITTANVTGGVVAVTGGAMTTTTVSPPGTVSAAVTGFLGAPGGSMLTVVGANASVTVGAGASVGTADFSAGSGSVTATPNALAIASQLQLANGIRATYTAGGGATSFAASGANLVDNAVARTLTLSGGKLAFASAVSLPSVAGIRLRLESDSLSQGDGTPVSQWNDTSGNNFHATQGTADRQPLFIAGGSPNGWFGSVRFDGLRPESQPGDYLSNGSQLQSGGNGTTFFIVYKPTNTPATGEDLPFYFGAPGANGSLRSIYISNGAANPLSVGWAGWGTGDYPNKYTVSPGTSHLASFSLNDARNYLDMYDRMSGDPSAVNKFSGAVAGLNATGAGYMVGGAGVAIGGANRYSFAGDISAVLVYTGQLGDADRQTVDNYLYNKYFAPSGGGKITLPNTAVAATSSSTLDLGVAAENHTLGSLGLTAGGSETLLDLTNATSLTVSGITATGTVAQTARVFGTNVLHVASGRNVDVATNVTLTLQVVIGSTNELTKTSPGTLVLPGGITSTYSGVTVVNSGRLQIDGILNAQSSGVTVKNSGTLCGTGTVNRAVSAESGGAVDVGTNTTFSVTDFTMESGATFRSAIGSGGIGRVNTSGTVTLGSATLSVTGSDPVTNAVTLISNNGGGGVVGTFAGLPERGFVRLGGVGFRVTYTGGDGNDVQLVPVPQATVIEFR